MVDGLVNCNTNGRKQNDAFIFSHTCLSVCVCVYKHIYFDMYVYISAKMFFYLVACTLSSVMLNTFH